MQFIDKSDSQILSTEYKQWVDGLEKGNNVHPENSKYRPDVVMNLLYCQKGVCAYTEMRLCASELVSKSKWKNGRYKEPPPDKFGSLEHFDPRLKIERFWKWENLFMVHSDINTKKGRRDVDDILKPDSPGYDPFKLLEYNINTHFFSPNRRIKDKAEKDRIEQMIKVLQLNHGSVRYERKSFFKNLVLHHKLQRPFTPDRFFTAHKMAKEKILKRAGKKRPVI